MLSITTLNARNRQHSITHIVHSLCEAYGRRPTWNRRKRIRSLLDAMKSTCPSADTYAWWVIHGAQVAMTAMRIGKLSR